MAFRTTPPTFLRITPYSPESDRVNSIARCSAVGSLARASDAGRVDAKSTFRFAWLDRASGLGQGHRGIFAHGLCLLVVALGEPHDSVVLAISQRPPHRPGHGRKHGIAFSLWRNGFLDGLSFDRCSHLWHRTNYAAEFLYRLR